jgi:recombination protein RecA
MKKNEKDVKKEKTLSVEEAIKMLDGQFGKGTIIKLDKREEVKLDVIPTGALSLDLALGVMGIPKGRITEIFGGESSGKSTLCMSIAKNAQLNGDLVCYIDLENAFDTKYAKQIGLDISSDKLLISQPNSGDEALTILEKFIETKKFGLIIIDSVAAMAYDEEFKGEITDNHMGIAARKMSQALRMLTAKINKANVAVIFINQIRDKIGVMGFGDPTTTPGGRALKFYSSIRIKISRITSVKNKDDVAIGNHVKAKIVKNKCAVPFLEGEFDIIFGRGIKRISAIIEVAIDVEVITKVGNTFMFEDKELCVGRNNIAKVLIDNKEMLAKIERLSIDKYLNNINDMTEVENVEEKEEIDEAEEKINF